MTTSKKIVAHVAFEKLVAIVKEAGLKTEEKKAWLKVNGPHGRRVYVPKRKTVGRVDIAGFPGPKGTSVQLGPKSFGAVEEQLDFDGTEEKVLQNFRAVLKQMTVLPPQAPPIIETKKKDELKHEATRAK